MSRDYAQSRVAAALEESKGNTQDAKRLIGEWIEDDVKLLRGLVAPHLNGIITHAISYVSQPREPAAARVPEMAQKPGVRIMQGVVDGRGDVFGATSSGTAPKPSAASDQHVAAIQKIAQAGENKE